LVECRRRLRRADLEIRHTGPGATEHAGRDDGDLRAGRVDVESHEQALRAESAVLAEIDRLAGILSSYDADSEVNRWMRTRDKAVPVSAELSRVLCLFDDWRVKTGGALDPAAAAASQVWREAETRQQLPSDAALADAVATFDHNAIIFDCPPGLDHLERFGLVAAEMALIVVDAHPFAIQGAARVIETLSARRQKNRPGAQRWSLVMSRVDLRRTLDKDLDAALNAMFPEIDRLLIRQDVALALATTERTPVMQTTSHTSRGVADLQGVVGWLQNG
jgi:cellulose biosynthesis protein BcsQ